MMHSGRLPEPPPRLPISLTMTALRLASDTLPPRGQGRGFRVPPIELVAVREDGFAGTAFHRLVGIGQFLSRLRLFHHEGVTLLSLPAEDRGRGFTAQVAVQTLVVHIILPRDVVGESVNEICGWHPETSETGACGNIKGRSFGMIRRGIASVSGWVLILLQLPLLLFPFPLEPCLLYRAPFLAALVLPSRPDVGQSGGEEEQPQRDARIFRPPSAEADGKDAARGGDEDVTDAIPGNRCEQSSEDQQHQWRQEEDGLRFHRASAWTSG
jgi:hypothetical protein